MKGSQLEQPRALGQTHEEGDHESIGADNNRLKKEAEAHNTRRLAFKPGKPDRASLAGRYTSFVDQSRNSDLGFYEPDSTLADILTLKSIHRRRCEAGYLFSPTKNVAIVSDSHWLQSFWTWIGRAMKISKSNRMLQDNLDFSFLGVHAIWMEDVPYITRSIGPSSNKVSRHIEALTRRLGVSSSTGHSTEYDASRKLCLHVSDLAWTFEELEAVVNNLVSQNRHTKAAALALFADERKLAYSVLRRKSATQNHRMLAMAIAGAMRKTRTARFCVRQ